MHFCLQILGCGLLLLVGDAGRPIHALERDTDREPYSGVSPVASSGDLSSVEEARLRIAETARGYLGSEKWGYYVPPPGYYKCNIFVHDIIREAGVRAPVNARSKRPVMAARWASARTRNLRGWVIVRGGAAEAKIGDVVSYTNPTYESSTGHVGIVVAAGPDGMTASASDGNDVVINTMGFDGKDEDEGRLGYVFRRWAGPQGRKK